MEVGGLGKPAGGVYSIRCRRSLHAWQTRVTAAFPEATASRHLTQSQPQLSFRGRQCTAVSFTRWERDPTAKMLSFLAVCLQPHWWPLLMSSRRDYRWPPGWPDHLQRSDRLLSEDPARGRPESFIGKELAVRNNWLLIKPLVSGKF